jgi:hypothetical protein
MLEPGERGGRRRSVHGCGRPSLDVARGERGRIPKRFERGLHRRVVAKKAEHVGRHGVPSGTRLGDQLRDLDAVRDGNRAGVPVEFGDRAGDREML